ncbi:MAG: lysophospholipid acyltransferase family protein [Eubacteriales bacterium]
MSFYKVARACLGGFFRRLYRVKIIGAENRPESGPFLICSNHLSNSDVVVIAACFKPQVRYFAKKELFKIPGLKQLITLLGAFPVDRSDASASVSSIKNTISLLEKGEVVGIFPQGKRFPGKNPNTTKPKNGVGMIEYHAKVKVIPVLLQNKKWKICPFRKTIVHIGKPIEYDEFTYSDGKGREFAEASELIFSRILEMADAGQTANANR